MKIPLKQNKNTILTIKQNKNSNWEKKVKNNSDTQNHYWFSCL